MKNKIVITTTSFAQYDKRPLTLLNDKGFEVILNPNKRKLDAEEIVKLCKDAIGIVAGTEKLDEPVLKQLSSLKVISRCGTGLENVALDAAEKLNIKVYNTPDAPTLAVAELTVGLMLNLLRKVSKMDIAAKGGGWEKLMGNLLSGKNVGIIGLGRIGRNVVKLLSPFGCKLAYYDTSVKDKLLDLNWMTLEELLRWADIISIHAAGKETIIGGNELRIMKKGAWLINTSRGEAVNEKALYAALKNGDLSGAALDVFQREPYDGPLKELDNVILTPHIGSYAKETRVEMEMEASKNLLAGLGIK